MPALHSISFASPDMPELSMLQPKAAIRNCWCSVAEHHLYWFQSPIQRVPRDLSPWRQRCRRTVSDMFYSFQSSPHLKNGCLVEVPQQLIDAQSVLRESLIASFSNGLTPEALTTIAQDPFAEIIRVARDYRCASVLLGFSKIVEQIHGGNLEQLLSRLDSDIVILRAPPGWTMQTRVNAFSFRSPARAPMTNCVPGFYRVSIETAAYPVRLFFSKSCPNIYLTKTLNVNNANLKTWPVTRSLRHHRFVLSAVRRLFQRLPSLAERCGSLGSRPPEIRTTS